MSNQTTHTAGCLFCCLLFSMSVFALHADDPPASTPTRDEAPAKDDGTGKRRIAEEITVTARRMEEPLSTLPAAATVLTENDIEANGVHDLLNGVSLFAPSFSFTSVTKNQTYLALRGSVSMEDSPATDQAVGVFVDEIYRGRVADLHLELLDIARIEILRGPQGTAFGRNVVGGAINITTRKPDRKSVV